MVCLTATHNRRELFIYALYLVLAEVPLGEIKELREKVGIKKSVHC